MNIASALQGSTFKEPSAGLRAGNGKDAAAGPDFEAMLKKKPATATTDEAAVSDACSVRSEPRANERITGADVSDVKRPTADSEDMDQSEPTATQAPSRSEDAAWPPLGLALMALAPVAATVQVDTPSDTQAADRTGLPSPAGASLPSTAQLAASTRSSGTPAIAVADVPELPTATTIAANKVADTGVRDAEVPSTGIPFNPLLQVNAALDARAASAPASGASHLQHVTPDIREGNFGDAVSARISWLAEQKIGHAHVSINPPNLGQIEVKLQLEGDRVHATFASAHAEVRHALETSIPRLREMLGDSGLQLTHADVRQQQASQQQAHDGHKPSTGAQATTTVDAAFEKTSSSVTTVHVRGLLDTYA